MDWISKIGGVMGLVGADARQDDYDDGFDDQGQYYDDAGQDGYEPEMYQDGYEEPAPEPVHHSESARARRRGAATPEYEQPETNNVFAGRRSGAQDNVVPMNAAERKPQKMRVENLMPEVSNEANMNAACERIINRVMGGEILIISTVNVDDKQRTRMVLMLSGASFAMNAHFTRINATTYAMVPKNVELSEEAPKPRTTSFFEGSDFFGSK